MPGGANLVQQEAGLGISRIGALGDAMTTTLPLIGEDFAGYWLRSILGRGGMSVVYEAENMRLGSTLALKVLAPELATQDVFRSRFLQESRIAASLNHPNVIPIYDMGPCGDLLYIAMRYVSGADLRVVLKTYGHITPDQAVLLVGQAARALDAAHRQGLVHRDVKPGNILIERGEEDEPDHVYLSDFGITKHALSQTGLTATGQFVGTIDYIAPEQIQDKPVDARTDIYSLGCVLYECLTGRVPFKKDVDAAVLWAHVGEPPQPPSAVRPDLPRGLDDVVLRALAKDPNDRYGTCREFLGAAQKALAASGGRDTTVMQSPTSVLAAPPPTRPQQPKESERVPSAVPSGGGWPSPVDRGSSPPVDRVAPSGGGAPPPDWAPTTRSSRPRQPRRWRWLAAAAVVVVALAGGAVALALSGGDSNASSHDHVAGHTGKSSMAKAPARPPNQIIQALTVANESADAKGLIPPQSCKPMSATIVSCTHPHFGADSVRIQTYPSTTALYSAYVSEVKSVSGAPFQANFNDCNPDQTNGEVSWNHAHQHPKIYSIQQIEMGDVTDNQAAGRVFCTFANSELNIVWTQDDGHMLGVVSGAPHLNTWYWWYNVHHNIDLTGSGMQSMSTSGMQMSTTK